MNFSMVTHIAAASLAAWLLTVDGAFAAKTYNASHSNTANTVAPGAATPAPAGAINLNSSRSNIYRLDNRDPNAAKACSSQGGTVSNDKAGQKICSINYNASKSNTAN
jgi:hypothetical protein